MADYTLTPAFELHDFVQHISGTYGFVVDWRYVREPNKFEYQVSFSVSEPPIWISGSQLSKAQK